MEKRKIIFIAPEFYDYHKIINREAEFMSEEGKQRLIKNFLESCEHERRFFNMAYTQENWGFEV